MPPRLRSFRKEAQKAKEEAQPEETKVEIKDPEREITSISFSTKDVNFTQVAPEIFINICKFLPPIDLLSLAQVCRLFNEYLSSKESESTELIWRKARLTFLSTFDIGPPDGMSERDYIRLIVEKGCQLCGNKSGASIHWEFLVRVCNQCFKANIASFNSIMANYQIPLYFYPALPCYSRADSGYFWLPHVKKFRDEYNAANSEEKLKMLQDCTQKSHRIMLDKRARETSKSRERTARIQESAKKRKSRQDRIHQLVDEMSKETYEDGTPKFDQHLLKSNNVAYCKAINSTSTSLTDRAWRTWRKKIEKEYYSKVPSIMDQ
ncbi:946_t:CDS:2 [Ambispora leptoticha]|uniref:946_t:CDS:1 n=1 Tax=Ambispora leptoticha TaxID=144679 RepID=A0A9N9AQ68_9GLOM|nr:946_t:CDS:2 [Ambispora leptoticha]